MWFHIDAPMATVIVAALGLVGTLYNTWRISTVHTLVNSNFTEAKQARVVAEEALKAAKSLNDQLQHQLDTK